MEKTKFVRFDEETHKQLKLYTILENKRNINDAVKQLLLEVKR